MISNQNTSTDPQLSREEAIEILNTPDENLDELIAGASERVAIDDAKKNPLI